MLLIVVLFLLLVDLAFAWLLQVVLLAFGVHLSLLICFIIIALLSFIFRRN